MKHIFSALILTAGLVASAQAVSAVKPTEMAQLTAATQPTKPAPKTKFICALNVMGDSTFISEYASKKACNEECEVCEETGIKTVVGGPSSEAEVD